MEASRTSAGGHSVTHAPAFADVPLGRYGLAFASPADEARFCADFIEPTLRARLPRRPGVRLVVERLVRAEFAHQIENTFRVIHLLEGDPAGCDPLLQARRPVDCICKTRRSREKVDHC